jgi:hypothetical protein
MYPIYESAGDCISKLKNFKPYMKVQAVICINNAQNLTVCIIINRLEIRYVWRIRMNQLTTLCRPKGHKFSNKDGCRIAEMVVIYSRIFHSVKNCINKKTGRQQMVECTQGILAHVATRPPF